MSRIKSQESPRHWLEWFLSLKGNELFTAIDEEYINDRFHLFGLMSSVSHFQLVYALILDKIGKTELTLDGIDPKFKNEIDKNAKHLYGLIHARYILTQKGLLRMAKKFRKADFGRCPRVLCQGQELLPVGTSDVPFTACVKFYCPRCEDVYNPRNSKHNAIDGAYFGTTFPHLLLNVFPDLIPQKSLTEDVVNDVTQRYVPKIFGFRIHDNRQLLQRQQELLQKDMQSTLDYCGGWE